MKILANSAALAAKDEVPKLGALEYFFWGFILVAVGRVGELIPGLSSLPMAKITIAITLLLLIGSWRKLPSLAPASKPLAKTATWLVALCLVLTPISYWRGASIAFLYQQLVVLIAVVIISYKLSRSWKAVRGTLLTLVVAGLLLTRAALSGFNGGRAAADTMYDTNDLAYLLITVFPLAIGFSLTARTKMWKLIYAGVAASFVAALLLTSSRGGFLGLVAVGLCMVFLPLKAPSAADPKKPGKKKGNKFVLPLLGALALGAVVWPQLPVDTRERLASILSLGNDYNLDATNEKSRGRIWRRGVIATVQRPWGYGPAAFGMVDLQFGGKMMAPHNSFVQAMVELGVVGVLLLLRMYILCWRGLGRARKAALASGEPTQEAQEQAVLARMLQLGLVGNIVAGFFLSMAYATLLWVMFGITMATLAVISRSHPSAEEPEPLPAVRRRASSTVPSLKHQ